MKLKGYVHVTKERGEIFYDDIKPAINACCETRQFRKAMPTITGGFLLEYEIDCNIYNDKQDAENLARGHLNIHAHNVSWALGSGYSAKSLVGFPVESD